LDGLRRQDAADAPRCRDQAAFLAWSNPLAHPANRARRLPWRRGEAWQIHRRNATRRWEPPEPSL